eukprot:1246256-Rhodomonas_salina.3
MAFLFAIFQVLFLSALLHFFPGPHSTSLFLLSVPAFLPPSMQKSFTLSRFLAHCPLHSSSIVVPLDKDKRKQRRHAFIRCQFNCETPQSPYNAYRTVALRLLSGEEVRFPVSLRGPSELVLSTGELVLTERRTALPGQYGRARTGQSLRPFTPSQHRSNSFQGKLRNHMPEGHECSTLCPKKLGHFFKFHPAPVITCYLCAKP